MKRYEIFTEGSTPNESKSMLKSIESKYGFVPNLTRGMKQSPQLLESYMSLSESFEATSLSPKEREIVQLTVSRFNECEYCTSVHSMMAEKTGLEWDAIEKIRNRETLSDERLEALRKFSESAVKRNGNVPHDVWTQFKSAGFSEQNALEVILGVTLKTLTNATNHLIETPLDEAFQKRAWSTEQATTAATA